MSRQISVLGTGWLGLPLSIQLLENGHTIKGATTSITKLKTLNSVGISPYQITLWEDSVEGDIENFLSNSSILLINIPPGLRKNPKSNFISKIKNLIPHIENSTIKKVIFISSTTVFKDEEIFPIITDDTKPNAQSNSGKQLIEAERLLNTNSHFDTSIIRFSGLFNEERHPAKFLSKKNDIKNPKAPVNLIHLDDCIGIIQQVLKTNFWNQTINAAYPKHPEKSKYYSEICTFLKLPFPNYDHKTPSKGKQINSLVISEKLNYKFRTSIYPSTKKDI